ncbi:hypothetical protein [Parvicella tangerina]|uniref:Uncharacterized protein n=1 Tax=Parvicella tangerina TaxID=2829795 RepID=A0A916JQ76_9FLAO|nr:hypothetical protein [Parvicella tangerina]CAG5086772.1 hypothetical protein CRYO30217_03272 [Parvicella tangerina]
MTREAKIHLVIGFSSVAIIGLGAALIVPGVRKRKVRERLDDAYGDPYKSGAVGGIESLQASSAFDPNRHLTSGRATISRLVAIDRAKKVWDNYGSWYSSDNESAIVNAFDGLGHYDDLSKIAYYFEQEYDTDLYTVLQDALKGDKVQTQLLMGKVANLPRT